MKKIPIKVEGFFKQQGVGSTIQSNDIEYVSISSQERSGLFLCKIVLNFICGNSGKNSSLVGEILSMFSSLLKKEVGYFFVKLCSISYVAIPARTLR